MKKNLLLSLAITLLFSISALAQTGTTSLTLTIGDKTNPLLLEDVAGSIEIPVFLQFTDDVEVNSFDFRIEFDGTTLQYDGAEINSEVPGANAFQEGSLFPANPLAVTWAFASLTEPGIVSTTLTDDLLLTLKFTAFVGTSSLTFVGKNVQSTGSAFYSGSDGLTGQISTTFTDGFITISSAVPLSMWAFFLMAGLIIAFLAFRAVRLF
jgi:hypothetical protein